MKKFIKQKNMDRGFTLVETLVAISIFTMSVITLIVILSQGITNINYAKQKVIAEYLAQEGIEYIKNIRDTNVISATTTSVGWTAFKAQMSTCFSIDGCYFDDNDLLEGGSSATVKNIGINACPPGACPKLLYDLGNNSNGKYNYNYGLSSPFSRTITMIPNGNDEVEVKSVVSWTQGSGLHSISFSNSLFNWIE